jgi:hypothetical protein
LKSSRIWGSSSAMSRRCASMWSGGGVAGMAWCLTAFVSCATRSGVFRPAAGAPRAGPPAPRGKKNGGARTPEG